MKRLTYRHTGLFAFALLATLAFAGVAASQDAGELPEGKNVTLTGYVRDSACLITRGLKGRAHQACTVMCAHKGIQLGIEADGAYYLAVAPGHPVPSANSLLEPYAEKKVKVTGIVNEALGQRVITITKVEPAS